MNIYVKYLMNANKEAFHSPSSSLLALHWRLAIAEAEPNKHTVIPTGHEKVL